MVSVYSPDLQRLVYKQGRCKCGRFLAYWKHYCERCRAKSFVEDEIEYQRNLYRFKHPISKVSAFPIISLRYLTRYLRPIVPKKEPRRCKCGSLLPYHKKYCDTCRPLVLREVRDRQVANQKIKYHKDFPNSKYRNRDRVLVACAISTFWFDFV